MLKTVVNMLRIEYLRGGLSEADAGPDPFALFERWFKEAVDAGIQEANALTLATATPDGLPSARVVLLKDFDARGLTFYTNYASRKGRELEVNPRAMAVFFWQPFYRQVRIAGRVERVSPEESDAYYHSRPREARLAAWASQQSARLESRAALEAQFERVQKEFAGREPPRPPYWGGYRLVPAEFEFWQGRVARLHDRLLYERLGEGWAVSRLSP